MSFKMREETPHQKHHPSLFRQTLSPHSLNLPTVQPLAFFSLRTLKKNHISQSTPIILKLKVTKFLVELSQFKLLVNTDNKHFCLQAFFVMKYSCIFYAKTVPQEERGRGTLC